MNNPTFHKKPPTAYIGIEVTKMRLCCKIGCKQAGLTALAFCTGTLAGLLLPIYIIAVVETALIIFLGYCCLFKW